MTQEEFANRIKSMLSDAGLPAVPPADEAYLHKFVVDTRQGDELALQAMQDHHDPVRLRERLIATETALRLAQAELAAQGGGTK